MSWGRSEGGIWKERTTPTKVPPSIPDFIVDMASSTRPGLLSSAERAFFRIRYVSPILGMSLRHQGGSFLASVSTLPCTPTALSSLVSRAWCAGETVMARKERIRCSTDNATSRYRTSKAGCPQLDSDPERDYSPKPMSRIHLPSSFMLHITAVVVSPWQHHGHCQRYLGTTHTRSHPSPR